MSAASEPCRVVWLVVVVVVVVVVVARSPPLLYPQFEPSTNLDRFALALGLTIRGTIYEWPRRDFDPFWWLCVVVVMVVVVCGWSGLCV